MVLARGRPFSERSYEEILEVLLSSSVVGVIYQARGKHPYKEIAGSSKYGDPRHEEDLTRKVYDESAVARDLCALAMAIKKELQLRKEYGWERFDRNDPTQNMRSWDVSVV